MRWTPARRMRLASLSRMMAPSILANSRSPVAVNGTSSAKPPVEIDSICRSYPTTISAPVRPRRTRSRPSRSAVPGATEARLARMRAAASDFSMLPSPNVAMLLQDLMNGTRTVYGSAWRIEYTQSRRYIVDLGDSQVAVGRSVDVGSGRNDRVPEADSLRFAQSSGDCANFAYLAGQSDFTNGNEIGRQHLAPMRRSRGDGNRKIDRRLNQTRSADRCGVDVIVAQFEVAMLGQHSQDHGDPG